MERRKTKNLANRSLLSISAIRDSELHRRQTFRSPSIAEITATAFEILGGFIYRTSRYFKNVHALRILRCSLARPRFDDCSVMFERRFRRRHSAYVLASGCSFLRLTATISAHLRRTILGRTCYSRTKYQTMYAVGSLIWF
jgi:hypothetical protein